MQYKFKFGLHMRSIPWCCCIKFSCTHALNSIYILGLQAVARVVPTSAKARVGLKQEWERRALGKLALPEQNQNCLHRAS